MLKLFRLLTSRCQIPRGTSRDLPEAEPGGVGGCGSVANVVFVYHHYFNIIYILFLHASHFALRLNFPGIEASYCVCVYTLVSVLLVGFLSNLNLNDTKPR